MSIQIEILSAKPVTTPSSKGKPYTFLDLAYKNLTFQGKVEGKKIMSFGSTEAAFKTLSLATSGEVYDIEVVKNAAGYNDFVSAVKANGASPASVATQRSAGVTGTTTPKSTYETPEERAKKQIYIVRQSSLSTAADLLSVGAKTAPDPLAVIEVAKKFESFVFGSTTPAPSEVGATDFSDLLDDIPY